MTNWNELFEQSRAVALAAHGNQLYGHKPYEHHLQAVVAVLNRFGISLDNEELASVLIAAWLHDSIEDTNLTQENIRQEFGSEVADLVWRVTDEPGNNRKERKAATYQKISESENAIILKLADRIANVESSLQNNHNLFLMYKREHSVFSERLKPQSKTDVAARMWKHLDDLFSAAWA